MSYRTVFSYLPYLFALGAFALYVVPARYRVRGQALWLMLIVLAAAKFTCFAAFGGDLFEPNLPAPVIWTWDFLYSGMVLLTALSLAWCVVTLPFGCVRKRAARFVRVALPVAAWSLSAWGVWNGVRPPDVVAVEFAYPDLPASLDGYRVVQLTDLHISSAAPKWRTAEVVARVNALKPDLVCLTGDLADGDLGRIWRNVMPLGDLAARDGVYAVTGNHEYYGDWFHWRDVYERCGLRFLHNECVFPRAGLALAGVNDDACERVRSRKRPDVGRAFAAATNGEFRVLLQHRPRPADGNAQRHGVRLQLSGHTHGGIAPGLDLYVATFNGGYVHGVYELPAKNAARLYVSRGTGQWAGFPIRFFNPSEITLLTLRREAHGEKGNERRIHDEGE